MKYNFNNTAERRVENTIFKYRDVTGDDVTGL